MSNRIEIQEELLGISPLVAGIEPVNPYEVPAGYFNSLAAQVHLSIKQSLAEPAIALPAMASPYQVPEGYFDALPAMILQRIHATEAQEHAEEIEHLSPLLSKLNKPVPFSVPEGYFENFPGDLVDGVRAVDFVNAELEEYSPLLASVKSKNVYLVPAGYFEGLATEVLEKARSAKRPGSIIRNMKRQVLRYSIAAMIVGVITLGGWLFTIDGNQKAQSITTATGIDNISNEEMVSYLEQSPDNDASSTDSYDMKEEDVKELMADLSDDELKAYLEQNASSKDLND